MQFEKGAGAPPKHQFPSEMYLSSSQFISSANGAYFYKVVARCGPRLLSIFDGNTEYTLGSNMKKKLVNGPSGFYVYSTMDEALNAKLPQNSALLISPRVILKCHVWGEMKVRDNIYQFSRLRPVEVIPCPSGYVNIPFNERQLTNTRLKFAREILPPFYSSRSISSGLAGRRRQDMEALVSNIRKMEQLEWTLKREQMNTRLTPGFMKIANDGIALSLKRHAQNEILNGNISFAPKSANGARSERPSTHGGNAMPGGAGAITAARRPQTAPFPSL